MLNSHSHCESLLIPRENAQNASSLNPKLITLHSEDRDVSKWPNQNMFEVMLPQTYTNVKSISLIEHNFTTQPLIFTNENQNVKMSFIVTIKAHSYGKTNRLTLTIDEGTYTTTQLAYELQNKFNKSVRDLHFSLSSYNKFYVFYHEVQKKFLFGNSEDPFEILFDQPEPYKTNCGTASNWNNYSNWGLAFNLGFVKTVTNKVISVEVSEPQKVYYTSTVTEWLPVASIGGKAYVVVPNNAAIMSGPTDLYIELDKCNNIDEIEPYSSNTTATHLKKKTVCQTNKAVCQTTAVKNDYNGIVNSAFAKISLSKTFISEETTYGHVNFSPPLDKLNKLKFKFRYHDGALVNFGSHNFSLTMKLQMYR